MSTILFVLYPFNYKYTIFFFNDECLTINRKYFCSLLFFGLQIDTTLFYNQYFQFPLSFYSSICKLIIILLLMQIFQYLQCVFSGSLYLLIH